MEKNRPYPNKGLEAITRLLLKRGADIDSRDWPGRTPVWPALREGHKRVARLLFENGAGGDAKDRDILLPYIALRKKIAGKNATSAKG